LSAALSQSDLRKKGTVFEVHIFSVPASNPRADTAYIHRWLPKQNYGEFYSNVPVMISHILLASTSVVEGECKLLCAG